MNKQGIGVMQELTILQKKVLAFIIKCQKNQGIPPTIREIATHFKFKSTNNVRQHLQLIERKGYIRILSGKARGIEVVVGLEMDLGKDSIKVPLVGSIAAGKPITAIENIEDYITLDKNIFNAPELFTLRVNGDSMIDAGILDGDMAIIRQQPTAESGEIVVAVINGEVTLKRYTQNNGNIVLRAENSDFQDIIIPLNKGNELQIAGKLIGIIRKV